MEHEATELYGYKFFGTPYVPPIPRWAFVKKDEDRKKLFAKIPTETDILISHTPPKNILDSFDDEPFDSPRRFGC